MIKEALLSVNAKETNPRIKENEQLFDSIIALCASSFEHSFFSYMLFIEYDIAGAPQKSPKIQDGSNKAGMLNSR